jgi:hypothetical protein
MRIPLWCCWLLAGWLAGADRPAPPADWSAGGVVRATVPAGPGERWLDADLRLADDRWFSVADPVRIPPGEGAQIALRLLPSVWTGDGSLGPDALAAVTGFRPVLRDARGGVIAAAMAWRYIAADPVIPEHVRGHDGTRLDRGPWHEVRWRLLGAAGEPVESGEVEIVAADGRRRPAFLAQPGRMAGDRWRARGPALWVLRLAPEETAPGPWTVRWREGVREWSGSWDPPLAVRAMPLAEGPGLPMAEPEAAGGSGWIWRPDAIRITESSLAGTSLAPVVAWTWGAWASRGAALTAHARAAAEDRRLAGGATEIDLLPAWLGDERGVFRAGASPWAAAEGPAHLLADEGRIASLRHHQREVVARARAVPGLRRWRFGLRGAVDPASEARLHQLARETAAWLREMDGRSLVTDHPTLGAWDRTDQDANRRPEWETFAGGTGGWRGVFAPARTGEQGSDGSPALVLRGDGPLRTAAAVVELDAPLWNLDQIRADVRIDGPGLEGATWFAWVTDDGHRWFQRRIDWVPGAGRWTTLSIEMGDGWTGSGHDQPWRRDRLRRIRQVGLSVYTVGATGAWTASIDRLRRFGWPRLDRPPEASITVTAAPPATVRPWSPVRIGLAAAPETFNPYDPASADVGCMVVGPDGRERFWPAAWIEPRELVVENGREQVRPGGPGSWVWTFAPPAVGTWKIRPEARLRWQDRLLSATGAWLAVEVRGTPEVLLPIRVSARDPAWFETVDGAFFYPVGVNLRSPGDGRQNALLDASGPPARWVLPAGWRSEAVEPLGTAAFGHWFARSRAAGMNWARVWMAPWWCGLEWRRDWPGFNGIGWFNQDAAARLDRICDLAETHGIHLQIELQNHGMTSPLIRGNGGRGVDSQWRDSPWYTRNGGPFEHPAETFAEGQAWTALVNRHRYVLARWGWRTVISAWVLSSEMEFTGAWEREARGDLGRSPTTLAWVRRNLDWFAANDPQGRPVSVHFSHPWAAPDLWKMSGLGFNNSNAYTAFQNLLDQLGGGDPDIARACDAYLRNHFPPWDLGRPTIIGEWGGHWSEDDPEVLRREVRHGPWVQAVLPFAGNTGFWWWLWLDAEDRWSEFAGPARFARSQDPRGSDLRPVAVNGAQGARGVAAVGPRLVRAYVWSDRPRAGAQARVTGIPVGRWRVTTWSMAGEPGEVRDVTVADGTLTLEPGREGRAAFTAVPCPDSGAAGVSR